MITRLRHNRAEASSAAAPTRTDEAILRTLLYADIFDYPLTVPEIHHYLIATSASHEDIQAALQTSPWLAPRVTRVNGYVALRGREATAQLRDERQRHSTQLWLQARRWAYLIGCLPYVRMVAVTGALAVNNAPRGDDIDYLIVTAPGRVWLARGLVVGVVRLARLAGVGLCPNYVLAQSALEQRQRGLYAAHDLLQMVPVVGHAVHAAMLASNGWALVYLPHAQRPLHAEPELKPGGLFAWLQRMAERLLNGRLGESLERRERSRKLRKFSIATQQAGSAAELDAERIKGHFDDNGQPIMNEFYDRLKRCRQG